MKACKLAAAACAALCGPAFAQGADGPGTLAPVAGDAAEFTFIDQGGSNVEQIARCRAICANLCKSADQVWYRW
jgi:hypothetical protein